MITPAESGQLRIFCLDEREHMLIVFGLVCGVFVILSLIEVRHFLRARRMPDEFPYPRHRLVRRIAISIVFTLVVGLVAFWPPKPLPWAQQFVLLFVILVTLMSGLVLLWRDLRETSHLALEEASRLGKQTGEAIRVLIQNQPAPKTDDPQRAQTNPEPH